MFRFFSHEFVDDFFERGLSGDHDFLGASVYYFITVIYVYPLGIYKLNINLPNYTGNILV